MEFVSRKKEQAEIRTITYLTSGMKQRKITEMRKGQGIRDE